MLVSSLSQDSLAWARRRRTCLLMYIWFVPAAGVGAELAGPDRLKPWRTVPEDELVLSANVLVREKGEESLRDERAPEAETVVVVVV